MLKNANWLRVALVVIVMAAVLCNNASASVDIQNVSISTGKDHHDGKPLDQSIYAIPPWCFELQVQGSGITSVEVTLPDTTQLSLADWGNGRWGIEGEDYSTLTDLRQDYPAGEYLFTINGGADTVTIIHNEAEPSGIAEIAYPTLNASDVPYHSPTFSWESCEGFGQTLWLQVEDAITGSEVFSAGANINDTSAVIASGLLSGRDYYFGIDVLNYTAGSSTSTGGDAFEHRSTFYYFNHVEFATVPEPATLSLLLVGGLAFLRRKKRQ